MTQRSLVEDKMAVQLDTLKKIDRLSKKGFDIAACTHTVLTGYQTRRRPVADTKTEPHTCYMMCK